MNNKIRGCCVENVGLIRYAIFDFLFVLWSRERRFAALRAAPVKAAFSVQCVRGPGPGAGGRGWADSMYARVPVAYYVVGVHARTLTLFFSKLETFRNNSIRLMSTTCMCHGTCVGIDCIVALVLSSEASSGPIY